MRRLAKRLIFAFFCYFLYLYGNGLFATIEAAFSANVVRKNGRATVRTVIDVRWGMLVVGTAKAFALLGNSTFGMRHN